jgi:hypothetical protein
LGFGFALCARDRLRADGPLAAPAFMLVLTFAGVILMPVGLYLYIAHPAWTWMYLIDPDRVPALAIVPMLVLHAGALLGPYFLAARWVRADRPRLLYYAMAGVGVAFVVATAILWRRLFTYGSYSDFAKNTTLDLMDVKLGYVLAAVLLGIFSAATYIALELFRDSRRVRTR